MIRGQVVAAPVESIVKEAGTIKVRDELKPKDLQGISNDQIEEHWDLYKGYVKSLNENQKKLSTIDPKKELNAYQALVESLGYEYNGVVLHELFFENLGKAEKQDPSKPFEGLVRSQYGSWQAWEKFFSTMASLRLGPGWAVAFYDPRLNAIQNCYLLEHTVGILAGGKPLLVIDLWEHAYMRDYTATDRDQYVKAALKNVNWSVVDARLAEILPK